MIKKIIYQVNLRNKIRSIFQTLRGRGGGGNGQYHIYEIKSNQVHNLNYTIKVS